MVSLTKKYFKEKREPEEYPAIIDDTLLTSIVWIKSETDGDKILNSKIIADAWAAQNVPFAFWEKCVGEMEKLQEHGDINQEQIYQLEYDFLARRQLYEKTEGDITKLNMGDIEQILQQIEYNKHQELLDENERLKSENRNNASDKMDLSQRLLESKVNEYSHSFGSWMIWAFIRKELLLIICIILVVISQAVSCLQNEQPNLKLGIGAVVIAVVLKFFDKIVSSKKNSVSNYLLKKSKNVLKNKVESSEDLLVNEIVDNIIDQSWWFK